MCVRFNFCFEVSSVRGALFQHSRKDHLPLSDAGLVSQAISQGFDLDFLEVSECPLEIRIKCDSAGSEEVKCPDSRGYFHSSTARQMTKFRRNAFVVKNTVSFKRLVLMG